MRILSLEIENYAGIEQLEIDLNSKDAKVYGTNGAGKTTIANAFSWLMFGKDIDGKRIDNIVPIKDGEEQRYKDVKVKAVVNIKDGETKVFEKISKAVNKKDEFGIEQYTSTRRTSQYIDYNSLKVKEYEDEINNLIDNDKFMLLSNLNTFQLMNWKDKRKILFDLIDEIDDVSVINSDSDLLPIKELLEREGANLSAIQRRYKEELKDKKKQIADLPVKIQTLHDNLPKSDTDIKAIDKKINDLQTEINGATSDSDTIRKELKNELKILDQRYQVEKEKTDNESQNKLNVENQKLDMIKSDLEINQKKRDNIEHQFNTNNNEIEQLRRSWIEEHQKELEIKSREFNGNTDVEICTCCGQTLETEEAKEKHEEHIQKEFNKNNSNELDYIAKLKSDHEANAKKLKEINEALEKDIAKYDKIIAENEKEINHSKMRINNLEKVEVDYSKLESIEAEIKTVENKLANLTDEAVEIDTNDLKDKLNQLYNERALIDIKDKTLKEIEELKAEENELRNDYSNLNKTIYLIDKFNRVKSSMITDKINDKFTIAKFKMFEELKNGEVKETCEIVVDGVMYDKGLNNANKINTSLDIINTLSKHYEFEAPIFIDNAESVVDLFKTESQQIELIVSEDDKQLRLEVSE